MYSYSRMKIHIVGAGPTGMSIAWEILNNTDHEVIIYEKKDTVGGSWHEPQGELRDFHAPRMLFKNAFVNTNSLFKEMNMRWEDYFIKRNANDLYTFLYKNFEFGDYIALTSLALRVLFNPTYYKTQSLEDSIDGLSPRGKQILGNITYSIDGVGWDVMTAYEFVESFNQVGLSSQWEQKVSGRKMSLDMQKALEEKGVKFYFNTELQKLDYFENGFEAHLSNEQIISDGLLVLCIDNFPASYFVQDNWGTDTSKYLLYSSYTCLHVLLDYEEPIKIENEVEIASKTRWNILASVLPDGHTVSCVLCNLNEEILTTPPKELHEQIIHQLNLPEPKSSRTASGNYWENGRWKMVQSSGVLNKYGQVPFIGKNPQVALCGMMSPRETPYASIEAAIEVGRSFCHQQFNTRRPSKPFKVTYLLILIVFIILIIKFR